MPFLLLPVYTRVISKEAMGIFVLYQALVQLFIPILTLSLQNSVILNYYNLTKEKFSSYFTISLMVFVIIFSFFSTITIVFVDELSSISGFYEEGFYILLGIIFFQYISELRQAIWRNERKVSKFGVYTIIQTLLKSAFSIILVVFTSLSWKGILLGYLLGYIFAAIYSIFSFMKGDLFKWSLIDAKKFVLDGLRISFPISLHRISAWAGATINRVVVNNKMGSSYTASFGIASTFNIIGTVLFDALNKAYVPSLFEKLSKPRQSMDVQILRMVRIYYAIVIFVTVALSAFGYLAVGMLFGEEYSSSRSFIIPLTLATGFSGLYKIHVNFIFYSKKTYYITAITLFTALINIPLSVYLISNYGLAGAAYSVFVVNLIYYIMSYLISKKIRERYV